MELQVLVSKKGTKVVTATNLYQVLQLPNKQYPATVKKWLTDIYEFQDGIRNPGRFQDYARRKNSGSPIIDDYYLSIELAKLITLNSRSKVKQKYAKWLLEQEEPAGQGEMIRREQATAILEITKAMSMLSCQESCEKRHLDTYRQRNKGRAANWWKHRSEVLGYSQDDVRSRVRQLGRSPKNDSQRQLLMQIDPHETIRIGVIDMFMALGKNEHYARSMGDLAKSFARELQLEIVDDYKGGSIFGPEPNPELVNELRSFADQGALNHWAVGDAQPTPATMVSAAAS